MSKLWTGKLALTVIQFTSGKFGYVGSVPVEIAYIDATPDKIEKGLAFGQRFGPKTRVLDTEQAAIEFAASKGYTPKEVTQCL